MARAAPQNYGAERRRRRWVLLSTPRLRAFSNSRNLIFKDLENRVEFCDFQKPPYPLRRVRERDAAPFPLD